MSTRQRLPYAIIGLVIVLFALATLPGFLNEPREWMVPDAEGALRKNQSAQTVCGHVMGTSGADHTSGTVTLYLSHNDSTAQSSLGTATYRANGEWCYSLSASDTNHNGYLHLSWVPNAGVTTHQSYPVVAYDETTSPLAVNLTHVNGTAVTADNALVGVKVNSMANDTVTAAAIATDALTAQEIAADAIGASEIAADAIGASEIAAGAITSSEAPNLDAAVTSRLAPTVAARTLDVSATGEAGVDWANVGSPTTTLALTNTTFARADANITHVNGTAMSGGVITANVTQVNGGATTATFDTLASQISAIGSGTGAALNFAIDDDNTDAPLKSVTFAGSQTGTFANLLADDGTTHQIASAANAFDIVYGASVGAGRSATKFVSRANMAAVTDTATVYAYNFTTTNWDARATITGTTETLRDVPLLAGHTGTSGADTGKVYIRISFSEADAGTLVTDEAYVTAQQSGSMIGYADGAVWVKATGTEASVPYVNCTADNPCPWANATTVASALGLSRYVVTPGTTVTLSGAFAGGVMSGRSYTLALGGQNISGSFFEGVEGLSGIGTCATGEAIIYDSHVNSVTIGEADFVRAHLMGTITMSQDSVPYRFHDCTGVTGAKIVFTGSAQAAVISSTSGNLTIAGMQAGNTAYVDGNLVLTLDNTNTGGTVYISGAVRLTNSGSGQTIYRDGIAERLEDLTEDNAGTWRFTTDSLTNAPTGGSAPTVEEIDAELSEKHGPGPWVK